MKNYLLRPVENLSDDDNPWEPWYDKCFGFVISAEDEENARKLAGGSSGEENTSGFLGITTSQKNPWLDPKYTTCVELEPRTKEEIIIKDFNAA